MSLLLPDNTPDTDSLFGDLSVTDRINAFLNPPKKIRKSGGKKKSKKPKIKGLKTNQTSMTADELRQNMEDSLSEDEIYLHLAHWLSNTYPQYIGLWHFDRDLRLGKTQGSRVKTQAARYAYLNERGFPDFQLLVPRYYPVCEECGSHNGLHIQYGSLFLEIKTVAASPFLKDGSLSADKHVQEQHALHEKLRAHRHAVFFVAGLKAAQEKVTWYLEGGDKQIEDIKTL